MRLTLLSPQRNFENVLKSIINVLFEQNSPLVPKISLMGSGDLRSKLEVNIHNKQSEQNPIRYSWIDSELFELCSQLIV